MKVLTSIRKLLVTCSLALAMVSFYATAQGLHEYVFTQMWQALLVSAAIQTALFILNLKLIYFFTLNPRIVLILWATMLVSSSLFSFVFISNQMIISKNPQFTGISARQQLEFTTHLLLTD